MILTSDLACAIDPVHFCITRLDYQPDALQSEFLRSESKRKLLLCSRQWGKSTTTAAKVVHVGEYEAGSLIIVLSPSARQSAELIRKCETFLKRLGRNPRGDGENEHSIVWNDSRVVALPGSEATIRGFSAVRLLVEDEAARITDDLQKAASAFLAVGHGERIKMSTPFGKRGMFWEAWSNGGEHWERFSATAHDCERISAEFLAGELRDLGDLWFRQEYLCEFLDVSEQLFTEAHVRNALSSEVKPLW